MSRIAEALEIMSDGSPHRSSDLRSHGISSAAISKMLDSGRISSPVKGVFLSSGVEASETEVMISALAIKYDHSVSCLYSAARYHDLTDDMHAPWCLSLRHTGPLKTGSEIRVSRWQKEEAYALGVEDVSILGVEVRITNPARTVADMLRSRNMVPAEHSYGALAQFIRTGGNPEDVARLSRSLGYGLDFDAIVPAVRRLIDVGAIRQDPEEEVLDFKF